MSRRIWACPGALVIGLTIALTGCGSTASPSSARTDSSSPTAAPPASESLGIPSGLPTALPGGASVPAPTFILVLKAVAPTDSFHLEFNPPDPDYSPSVPTDFCGGPTTQPCVAGRRYQIGPILGLNLAGRLGYYKFEKVTVSPHTVTVFNEGSLDMSRSRTLTATYPAG